MKQVGLCREGDLLATGCPLAPWEHQPLAPPHAAVPDNIITAGALWRNPPRRPGSGYPGRLFSHQNQILSFISRCWLRYTIKSIGFTQKTGYFIWNRYPKVRIYHSQTNAFLDPQRDTVYAVPLDKLPVCCQPTCVYIFGPFLRGWKGAYAAHMVAELITLSFHACIPRRGQQSNQTA